jgi:hypothetical protein
MENFGKKAKDKVTGFTGIITSKHSYMSGCDQYGIQPLIDKSGKLRDIKYFDEGRIEIIGFHIDPESVKVKENGCDYREHP